MEWTFMIAYLPISVLQNSFSVQELVENASTAWQVLRTSRRPRPCHFQRAIQLWKFATLLLCPCLINVHIVFCLFPFSPHLLIRFTSLGLSSSHLHLSKFHLKLSLFHPTKGCWALTFWANPINPDTLTNDLQFNSPFIITTHLTAYWHFFLCSFKKCNLAPILLSF